MHHSFANMKLNFSLLFLLLNASLANSIQYWMITYFVDANCASLEHTNSIILDTCFSYKELTGVVGSYMWVYYHNFGNYVEVRRNEYTGNTICEGPTAPTTTGYDSYSVCTPVAGSTNKWYIATFPSDPVPLLSGSAIL